ncbi:carboxypeptidase regulatory-like domain-containing protein [Hyalangium gracile]|uniref:carboxypeptidase regulatory-like domain-containing protein n=1 Tax=Hyalangium gracile TaxID=394092 RepID=UPI001CCC2B6E|nr:carboxypeptidase regulatory-like domain-containing protein [Hyalangium gracile]
MLEVEVLSANQPLPGAQVQLYEREPADLASFPARWTGKPGGETGADGRWVLPVAPGSYYATARAPGLAPAYATVVHPPGSARTRVRLLLEEGAELVGTVLAKGTGEPVSLAEIILTPPALPASGRNRPDAPEEESLVATSSETGEFRFSGLAMGRYRIEVRAPGYVTEVLPSAPVPFGGRITLLMSLGGELEGTVLRADGQPAVEAEVQAATFEQETTVLTDDEGHFSFELPPGSYSLSARKGQESGALDQVVKLAVGQRVQGLRLQLGAGASVSGKVIHKDGTPVLGAGVMAMRESNWKTHSPVATDERGAFSISSLPAGTYDFQVLMPEGTDFRTGSVTLATGGHASVTLTAEDESSGGIHCQVQSQNQRALKGLRVRASAFQPQPPVENTPVKGITDRGGHARFHRLRPGMYRVELLGEDGSERVSLPVLVHENGIAPCVFYVDASDEPRPWMATVEGRVLQRSGEPAGEPVVIEFSEWPAPRRFLSDAQGGFRLTVSPSKHTVRVFRQRVVQCATGQQQVELVRGPNPELMLFLDEREPDLRLRVLDVDGAPAKGMLLKVLVHAGTNHAEFVQTDDQGRLDICLPSGASPRLPATRVTVSSFDAARAVTIDAVSGGRQLTVQLRALPTLQGRLVHARGAPIQQVMLNILSPESMNPLKSYRFAGDRFELPEFPLGPNLLVVNADGMRAALLLDLQPGERKVLELPVYPGVSMRGRFVDAVTRQPVQAQIVPPLSRGRFTEQDGLFSFRDLPSGELFLHISRPGGSNLLQRVTLAPERDNDLGDIPVPAP